jgi:hypothetical protein
MDPEQFRGEASYRGEASPVSHSRDAMRYAGKWIECRCLCKCQNLCSSQLRTAACSGVSVVLGTNKLHNSPV